MRLRGLAGPVCLWLLVMSALGLMVVRGQAHERDGLTDRFQSRAHTGAGFVAAYVDDVFKTEGRFATKLARTGWRPQDFAADAELLGFPAAVLLDRDGRVVTITPAAPELHGTDLASKYAHLSEALAGTPTVSGVVPSAVKGEPVVAFALPVTSNRVGVLSGAFSLTDGPLTQFLERQPIAGTHGVLLDADGEVIASSDDATALAQSLLTKLKSSQEPVVTAGRVVAAETVAGTGWTYVLDAPRTTLLAPATSNDLGEWALLAAAAVVSLAGLLIAQRAKHDRVKARIEKEQVDHRLRLTVANAPVGMTMVDLEHHFVEPNKRLCRMLGYSAQELAALTFEDVTHPDDIAMDLELLAELEAGEIESYELEKRYVRQDGSQLWGRLAVSLVRDRNGATAYFVSQIEDVTEVRKARTDLQHRALNDPLTGLANRSLLMDRLTLALGNERHQVNVGVGFCDLDHFKIINDTHGHHVGDEVLKEVARRLQESVRADDTVARLGGDEFVVLLYDVDSLEEATAVLDRAGLSVKEPIVVDGVAIRTSLSVGLAIAAPGSDPDVLLRDADAAMYVAKEGGRGRMVSAPETSSIFSASKV